MGSWHSNTKGTKLDEFRPTCFQWSYILRSATNWLSPSLPKPPFVHIRSRSSCFIIITTISQSHFPGRGRGGRGAGRGDPPVDRIPPPNTGWAEGPDNAEQAGWDTFLTGTLRELGRLRQKRGPLDAQPQHHPHKGRVGPVDRVETPGIIPGAFDPRPLGLVAKWVHQQKELFQGVTETRSKLLNSYFVLILVITLLHFLMYIWICVHCKIEKGNVPKTILPIE